MAFYNTYLSIVSYLFLRLIILMVGFMPFRLMYMFSDLIYLILFHLVRYRRKVVSSNLKRSFPEKSKDEIEKLTRKFYHHLCDISLESLKGFTMSRKEIVKRHKIKNPEIADLFFEKSMSVITVPGHYNNWEWGSLSPGLQIKLPIVGFYKPMSNKYIDTYAKRHRAKFNTLLASIKQTASTFEALSDSPQAYIMAADQSPSNTKDCYWFYFLNQDTPWLHGPEKYARKYKWPVVYVDIQKIKRGYYEIELVVLNEDSSTLADSEITRLYVQILEKTILQEPAFWLWSHKRWKHQRA